MDRGSQHKSRRYPRVTLPKGILVSWQVRIERVISTATSMGLGGVFVSTPKPPAVGDIVKLVLHVPGGKVRAVAVVRDSKPGRGMGLEFTAMKPEDRARVQQLLGHLKCEQMPHPA